MGESGGDDPTLPAGACEHRQPLSSFQLSARRAPAVNTERHCTGVKHVPGCFQGRDKGVQKGLYRQRQSVPCFVKKEE